MRIQSSEEKKTKNKKQQCSSFGSTWGDSYASLDSKCLFMYNWHITAKMNTQNMTAKDLLLRREVLDGYVQLTLCVTLQISNGMLGVCLSRAIYQ